MIRATRTLMFGGLFFFLFSCQSLGPSKSGSAQLSGLAPQLIVLHVGDLHGHISPLADGSGGYARLAAFIGAERAKAGPRTDVLVIAPGDLVDKGNLPCRKTRDRACLALLGELGVDLAVVGNAEIYRGAAGIAEVVQYSRIPWVSSNLRISSGVPAWKGEHFYRGQNSGAKLWVFSRVRNPYMGREFPSGHKLNIQETITSKNWEDWAQKSEIAPILWVHHQQWSDDLKFAQVACQTQGLRSLAFIAADDHKEQQETSYCAPVVQAAPFGSGIGKLVFRVDADGELALVSHELKRLDSSSPEDPKMLARIADIYDRVSPNAREVVGQAPGGMTERELGLWLAEAMRSVTHSDLALVNSGAIKMGLEPGAVTRDLLLRAAPYNNQIMGLDWSFSNLEKSLCQASQRQRDPGLDDGSDLYIAGGTLNNPGTPNCSLEMKQKRMSVKIVVDSYLVDRSARWLGRDLKPVAFRFGFPTEEVFERYFRQKGGFR